uniref:GH18 domain-containing protein n=1 Tax=Panagrolaimus sp. ES5 TaxID=591445 RepID=A0AC34GVS7_9BILA
MDLLNPGDLKWGAGNKFYNQIIELKFQQPELKTILSIGGTCDFKDMVIDDDKRQKFVKSAADFVNLFNFDGVDIDISQPIKNRQDLTNLINELKEVLPEKLVTISVPTTLKRFDSVYDVPAIAAVVDFVNILTIPKSTSFIGGDLKSSNTFDEMYNWVSNGMSKDKLVVGMGINENISRNSVGFDFTLDAKVLQ